MKTTWHFNSIHVGFFNAADQREDLSHLGCGHVLSFPSVYNGGKKKCSHPRTQVVKLEIKQKLNSPESVSNSILKVDEIVFVDSQQVACVEVHVSFLVDVTQLLLLSLLQVSRVASERCTG